MIVDAIGRELKPYDFVIHYGKYHRGETKDYPTLKISQVVKIKGDMISIKGVAILGPEGVEPYEGLRLSAIAGHRTLRMEY